MEFLSFKQQKFPSCVEQQEVKERFVITAVYLFEQQKIKYKKIHHCRY
jgi:hypothetical protein